MRKEQKLWMRSDFLFAVHMGHGWDNFALWTIWLKRYFIAFAFSQAVNLNTTVDSAYGPNTRLALSRLSEKEISIELIEVGISF